MYRMSTLNQDTCTEGESTLTEVLSDPKLLQAFEQFLRQTHSLEELLFVEAMSQLKHEQETRKIEANLLRIQRTFITPGSPFELKISAQNEIEEKIQSMRWAIITRDIAIEILQKAEEEILSSLKRKMVEFSKSSINASFSKSIPLKHQKLVVIIGGGFTGFTVASILDRISSFHVTLIDTKDSFEYTPGIVRKIVSPSQTSSLRISHDTYIRNGRFIIGHAENIDSEAHSIVVNGERIMFDYLVISTGSTHSSQFLKSTDISSSYRLSGLAELHHDLVKARRVLIIGGGLVGCDLAFEIARDEFPGAVSRKHVTLIESHNRLLRTLDKSQHEQTLRRLQKLGVEVICGERAVSSATPEINSYIGESGRIYNDYDKVFITTGNKPNSSILASYQNDISLQSCVNAWGYIRVRPTLQIEHWKYNHIFAGGDVTNLTAEKTGYAANIAGVCIARNICRLSKGKHPLIQTTIDTRTKHDKLLLSRYQQDGDGNRNIITLKRKLAFFYPAWASLMFFDERYFLKLVQSQAINASNVFGKIPRTLKLPSDKRCSKAQNKSRSKFKSKSL